MKHKHTWPQKANRAELEKWRLDPRYSFKLYNEAIANVRGKSVENEYSGLREPGIR